MTPSNPPTVSKRARCAIIAVALLASLGSASHGQTPVAPKPISASDSVKTSLRAHGDTAWLTSARGVVQFVSRRDTVYVTRMTRADTTSDAWIIAGDSARRVRDGATLPSIAIIGYRRMLNSMMRVDSLLRRVPPP